MIVCIDLDDTLLANFTSTFLPKYIDALCGYISEVDPQKVKYHLLNSTQKMIQKSMPAQTLEQTFDHSFYAGIGIPKDELKNVIQKFYSDVFPALRRFTEFSEGAINFVESLFEEGHEVIVATNPLFPRIATLQRLDWAGLSAENFPFRLISTFENFHFTKPHAAYYTEIFAQLGWPECAAVMIGDSLDLDILPASKLGLPTFWLTPEKTVVEHIHPLSSQGDFKELSVWFQSISSERFEPISRITSDYISNLKSTPAALETISSGLSQQYWNDRQESNDWSLVEIICHLRDSDKVVNLPRFHKALQSDNPFLPDIDTDSWVSERNYIQELGKEALTEFFDVRSELIRLLESLPAEWWKREVRHSVFGPTNPCELLEFIIKHDRTHIKQAHDLLRKKGKQIF
ncbi:MAG: DinB family protein [Anaerolineaceae bacterium]|nr:DinB family protein [Anaerolineaceae bacterium]